MKKVCLIGHFGGGLDFFDGQTVKTKNLYKGLERYSRDIQLDKLDTFQWKKNPFLFLKKVIDSLRTSDIIVVSVNLNGLRILIPLMAFFNTIYKKRIHYFEIGGALRQVLRFNKVFEVAFKSLTSVNLENTSNVDLLKERGFSNVYLVRNFKLIDPVREDYRPKESDTLNLVYFSTVCRLKGVLDIAEAVRQVNRHQGKDTMRLDIYGAISEDFKKEFYDYLEGIDGEPIRYLGAVSSERSVEIIREYFLLTFPTKCFDEGIPGTLIDSLYAGVPILSSRYGTCHEVVSEGVNGFTYNFDDSSDLLSKLQYAYNNQEEIRLMKKNCLKEAYKYSPEIIMRDFLSRI